MPAAGVGRRFGHTRPKQYAPLQGRTVIEWALAPFLADPACAGASISLASDDPYWGEVAGRLAKLPGRTAEIIVAAGGAERSQSVRKGLEALATRATDEDWVLVHDAARPCLSAHDLQQLLQRLGSHRVGGILATPAADTLKRASVETRAVAGPGAISATVGLTAGSPSAAGSRGGQPLPSAPTSPGSPGGNSAASPTPPGGSPAIANATSPGPEIDATVDRAGLWRALTPQMFRYKLLCNALDQALASGRLPTDEAQALEWTGEHPVLVQGSAANIKITSADDLVLAAALLNARESTTATR
jgi:2-C-methyl-D-erythritol 4-phosphate cytidylyltransferase